jgi:molybdopterin synthase sulfur carrier subunit
VIVRLLLFATAREAAGCSSDTYDVPADATVSIVLEAAVARYGGLFGDVLASSGVWVNGEEPELGRIHRLVEGDEIAVLPPVSGGSGPLVTAPG